MNKVYTNYRNLNNQTNEYRKIYQNLNCNYKNKNRNQN